MPRAYLGAGGPGFESPHSDQKSAVFSRKQRIFLLLVTNCESKNLCRQKASFCLAACFMLRSEVQLETNKTLPVPAGRTPAKDGERF